LGGSPHSPYPTEIDGASLFSKALIFYCGWAKEGVWRNDLMIKLVLVVDEECAVLKDLFSSSFTGFAIIRILYWLRSILIGSFSI
jgi:hypothetical protein